MAEPIDLFRYVKGAPPLWLLGDGRFSLRKDKAPSGMEALEALVAAARWVSSRRTTTFERLFPPERPAQRGGAKSPAAPADAARDARLDAKQAQALLEQLRGALRAAAVGGEAAKAHPLDAAELRSASLTVLSHIVATVLHDPGFRAAADAAAKEILALVEAEQGGDTARPSLRAHAIYLLQMRAPALATHDRARALALVKTLVRAAPPYHEMGGDWHFAMCSAVEFHDGECAGLVANHRFRKVAAPDGAPPNLTGGPAYQVFEAPFKNPAGGPIRIYARPAEVSDENMEMGDPFFLGLLINRHAQLGSFDLQAATVEVQQRGYKLLMNSQCAGLTTRFAITRLFPDADVYTSWDSTFFDQDKNGQVTASEGADCFVAILQGMAHRESHAAIEARIRKAQWQHPQAEAVRDFTQFIGPSNPLVVARYSDVNQDGKADFYDGFLDFRLRAIAEDVARSSTPRDPGVPPSEIGGEAALGLDWAADSLDRVTQYSEFWTGLPGASAELYAFAAGGFYDQEAPPADVPVDAEHADDLGLLPAVCRYRAGAKGPLSVEVMAHAWLSHAGKELKRMLCAAEAMNRALDLGYLDGKRGALGTPLARRGALLLTLAGLLDFPADQNRLAALWSAALRMLDLPPISGSVVDGCITQKDHDQDHYYGSLRGLRQLVGDGKEDKGDLGRADPLAWAKLASEDPHIGRARPLALGRRGKSRP
jgi:hypothetical protein